MIHQVANRINSNKSDHGLFKLKALNRSPPIEKRAASGQKVKIAGKDTLWKQKIILSVWGTFEKGGRYFLSRL